MTREREKERERAREREREREPTIFHSPTSFLSSAAAEIGPRFRATSRRREIEQPRSGGAGKGEGGGGRGGKFCHASRCSLTLRPDAINKQTTVSSAFRAEEHTYIAHTHTHTHTEYTCTHRGRQRRGASVYAFRGSLIVSLVCRSRCGGLFHATQTEKSDGQGEGGLSVNICVPPLALTRDTRVIPPARLHLSCNTELRVG